MQAMPVGDEQQHTCSRNRSSETFMIAYQIRKKDLTECLTSNDNTEDSSHRHPKQEALLYHLAAFISNPSSPPKSPRFHFFTSPPQSSQSFLSRCLLFSADEGGLAGLDTPLPFAVPVLKSEGAAAGRPKRLRAAGSLPFFAGVPKRPAPAGRAALRGEGVGFVIVVSSSIMGVWPVYGEFGAKGRARAFGGVKLRALGPKRAAVRCGWPPKKRFG